MKVLTMICAAALAVCGTGRAQSFVDQIAVHFSTPVTAGETTLPAGDYSIQVIRGASDNVVLKFRAASGTPAGVFVPVNRLSDSNVPTNGHVTVTLNYHNNSYHLDQVVLSDRTGFQVVD